VLIKEFEAASLGFVLSFSKYKTKDRLMGIFLYFSVSLDFIHNTATHASCNNLSDVINITVN